MNYVQLFTIQHMIWCNQALLEMMVQGAALLMISHV